MIIWNKRIVTAGLCWILVCSLKTAGVSAAPHHRVNAAGLPSLFEGDIVAVYSQILETYGPNLTAELVSMGILSDNEGHNTGTPSLFHLWPKRINDVTLVPFAYGDTFAGDKSVVHQALREIERESGVITFAHRSQDETPYLRLESRIADYPGWSHVGQQEQEQELNLRPEYFMKGPLQHLIFHALGFWHTNSRIDRDEYVSIQWQNILPGLKAFAFSKRVINDTFGSPYDYPSIMHYFDTDFSNGAGPTILAPEPIGQFDCPSPGDIVKLRLLYQCRSGPRSFIDYVKNPCTSDCKCWKMAYGCNGNHDACQGDLVCDSVKNHCVPPSSKSTVGNEQSAFMIGQQQQEEVNIVFIDGKQLSLLAVLVGCGGLIAFWVSRRNQRRNYQAL